MVVHHVDGQRMEKYYLIGTFLLSMGINIPPLALHQFGWDEGSSTCWYKNSNPTSRLNWIIGTQSFWIALAATIETICSCVILVFMYLCQVRHKVSLRSVVTYITLRALRKKERHYFHNSDPQILPKNLDIEKPF